MLWFIKGNFNCLGQVTFIQSDVAYFVHYRSWSCIKFFKHLNDYFLGIFSKCLLPDTAFVCACFKAGQSLRDFRWGLLNNEEILMGKQTRKSSSIPSWLWNIVTLILVPSEFWQISSWTDSPSVMLSCTAQCVSAHLEEKKSDRINLKIFN